MIITEGMKPEIIFNKVVKIQIMKIKTIKVISQPFLK
jgi:hypothetical protein